MGERFVPTGELNEVLQRLSTQQAEAVLRIVAAELKGISLERLFKGEDKICSRSTYWARKRGGWIFKPEFKLALDLARRDYRAFKLGGVVNEALDDLRLTTPLAAQDLRRQITGDVDAVEALRSAALSEALQTDERIKAITALGEIGTLAASQALVDVLGDTNAELRGTALEALGIAASGLSTARRMASIAVLDRASDLTADKGGNGQGIEALSDDELAEIARGQLRGTAPTGSGGTS
jgi:HEAT repeat protein